MGTTIVYSSDYSFFLKHQVAVSYSAGTTTIFSRLSGQQFYKMLHYKELTDQEINEHCFKIHELLKKERKTYDF